MADTSDTGSGASANTPKLDFLKDISGAMPILGGSKIAYTPNNTMYAVMFFGGIILWIFELWRNNYDVLSLKYGPFLPTYQFFIIHALFLFVLLMMARGTPFNVLVNIFFLLLTGLFVYTVIPNILAPLSGFGYNEQIIALVSLIIIVFTVRKTLPDPLGSIFLAVVCLPFLYVLITPLLQQLARQMPSMNLMAHVISTFFLSGGFWPFWMLYGAWSWESRIAKVFRFLIVIGYLIIFLTVAKDLFAQQDIYQFSKANIPKANVVDVKQAIYNTLFNRSTSLWAFLTNLPNQTSTFYQKQIELATGDPYTGQVDENQEEPLGVYLKDLEPSDPEYAFTEPVTVWGLLYARTLDQNITVNLSCNATQGTKPPVIGNVTPTRLVVETLDEVDIQCNFPENKLPLAINNVNINAEFNFETHSYIKTYFMSQDRVRSLKREGVDPLDQYAIRDKNPIAVYTAGPLYIGMETKSPPIGIEQDMLALPRLGISLNNKWSGGIKNITKIEIHVPQYANLTNCDKNHPFEPSETFDEGYIVYKMTSEGLKNLGGITDKYKNINCRIGIENTDDFLGNLPITAKNFKVTVEYVYELSESTPVKIGCIDANSQECKAYQGKGTYSGTNYNFENSDILFPDASGQKLVKTIIDTWGGTIHQETSGTPVPYCLVVGTIAQESGGNVNAVSGTGSKGLMQFTSGTAKQYGIDPNDPKDSIKGGVKFYTILINHFSRYGTPNKYTFSISSYNIGQGVLDKAIPLAGSGANWQAVSAQFTSALLKSTSDETYKKATDEWLDNKIIENLKHVPRVEGYTMYCEQFLTGKSTTFNLPEQPLKWTPVSTGSLIVGQNPSPALTPPPDYAKIDVAPVNIQKDTSASYQITLDNQNFFIAYANTTDEKWDGDNPFIKVKVKSYGNDSDNKVTADAKINFGSKASKNIALTRFKVQIMPTQYNEKRTEIFKDTLYGIYDDRTNANQLILLDKNNNNVCTVRLTQQNPVQTCSNNPWIRATLTDSTDTTKAQLNIAYK